MLSQSARSVATWLFEEGCTYNRGWVDGQTLAECTGLPPPGVNVAVRELQGAGELLVIDPRPAPPYKFGSVTLSFAGMYRIAGELAQREGHDNPVDLNAMAVMKGLFENGQIEADNGWVDGETIACNLDLSPVDVGDAVELLVAGGFARIQERIRPPYLFEQVTLTDAGARRVAALIASA